MEEVLRVLERQAAMEEAQRVLVLLAAMVEVLQDLEPHLVPVAPLQVLLLEVEGQLTEQPQDLDQRLVEV